MEQRALVPGVVRAQLAAIGTGPEAPQTEAVMGPDGCTWCGETDNCTCDGDIYTDFNLIDTTGEFTQWVSPRERPLLHDGQRVTLWGFGGPPMRAVVVRAREDDWHATFRLLRPGELRPGE